MYMYLRNYSVQSYVCVKLGCSIIKDYLSTNWTGKFAKNYEIMNKNVAQPLPVGEASTSQVAHLHSLMRTR